MQNKKRLYLSPLPIQSDCLNMSLVIAKKKKKKERKEKEKEKKWGIWKLHLWEMLVFGRKLQNSRIFNLYLLCMILEITVSSKSCTLVFKFAHLCRPITTRTKKCLFVQIPTHPDFGNWFFFFFYFAVQMNTDPNFGKSRKKFLFFVAIFPFWNVKKMVFLKIVLTLMLFYNELGYILTLKLTCFWYFDHLNNTSVYIFYRVYYWCLIFFFFFLNVWPTDRPTDPTQKRSSMDKQAIYFFGLMGFNGWQLAKMKKSIPDISLP